MLDTCLGNPSHVVSHENVKITTRQNVHKALRCEVRIVSFAVRHSQTFVFDILKTKAMSFDPTNAFA